MDDKELRSFDVQRQLHVAVREHAPTEFDALLADIEGRLGWPPYIAYVTGLLFDRSNYLLLALGAALGDVVDPYRRTGSQLIRHLASPQDRLAQWGTAVLTEALHTDGTDLPQPNDITCLVCVRPDQDGGRTSWTPRASARASCPT